MGSTSFLGFSYPNLLLVFLNLFVTQLPSLERWALLPFSYPNLLLVLLNLLFFRNLFVT